MQLLLIGETLKPLDDADDSPRHTIPQIGRIIGLRNMLAHEYHDVDDQVIWNVVTQNLPQLRVQLAEMLDRL